MGTAQAPNGGVAIQCGATLAATVTRCLISCAATISFSGSANGVGISVSFPPSDVFAKTGTLVITCAPESVSGGTSCSPPNGGCAGGYYWVPYPTCQCQIATSPIIVDTTGKGFHLTSAE